MLMLGAHAFVPGAGLVEPYTLVNQVSGILAHEMVHRWWPDLADREESIVADTIGDVCAGVDYHPVR